MSNSLELINARQPVNDAIRIANQLYGALHPTHSPSLLFMGLRESDNTLTCLTAYQYGQNARLWEPWYWPMPHSNGSGPPALTELPLKIAGKEIVIITGCLGQTESSYLPHLKDVTEQVGGVLLAIGAARREAGKDVLQLGIPVYVGEVEG